MSRNLIKPINSILTEWGFSWGGLIDNRKGEWLLFSQLLILFAHLIPKSSSIEITKMSLLLSGLGAYLFAIGIILACSSLVSLGKSLSPLPEPKAGASLITTGAYKNCRHPLYQAILVCSLGIALLLNSLIHLFLFVSLCIILRSKALREEKILLKVYPKYKIYRQNTVAILPFLPFLNWHS